jgi:DMSO/TMAO reductase YedYZ molybdopterin-dependent catalytic subunit
MTQRRLPPDAAPRVLPPGQRPAPALKPLHYGRVPPFRPESWQLTIHGLTADGEKHSVGLEEFADLPTTKVAGDLHCVARWTVVDNVWEGVAARTLLDRFPPADEVTHVLAWAEFGYCATLRLEDLASPRAILATHLNGEVLTAEHGYPVRLVVPHLYAYKGPKWLRGLEYLSAPVRGFWEDRGYHLVGDAWREERYSYQE